MTRHDDRALRDLQRRAATGEELADLAVGRRIVDALDRRTDVVGDLGEELQGLELSDTVAEAHGRASSAADRAHLLYRLIRTQRPRTVAELGTCFGVGAAHIALALARDGGGSVTTVEGSPGRQAVARSELEAAGITGVTYVTGMFDDRLSVLDGAELVFIDGNHYLEPTSRYVDEAVSRGARSLTIVLDDVADYSAEMDDAWGRLRGDRRFAFSGFASGIGVLTTGKTPLDTPLGAVARRASILLRRR